MSAPTRDLLSYFDELHRTRFEVPAVIHVGKDAKLLANLCRHHAAYVKPLMARFFVEQNAWVMEKGYSVGIFVSQFPRLLQAYLRQERIAQQQSDDWWETCKAKHDGRCASRYVHELKMQREET